MPAQSEAQRRYLNWRFGHAWVKRHHFDNRGSLPEHKGGKSRGLKRSGGKSRGLKEQS